MRDTADFSPCSQLAPRRRLPPQETRPIARGTAGVVAVPFAATNEGPERIACSASIAHWYSLDLGEAGQGESGQGDLVVRSETGEISILNEVEDRMPVTALWCGLAGRSWETRSPVPLTRRAGDAPAPIKLACAEKDDRLALPMRASRTGAAEKRHARPSSALRTATKRAARSACSAAARSGV